MEPKLHTIDLVLMEMELEGVEQEAIQNCSCWTGSQIPTLVAWLDLSESCPCRFVHSLSEWDKYKFVCITNTFFLSRNKPARKSSAHFQSLSFLGRKPHGFWRNICWSGRGHWADTKNVSEQTSSSRGRWRGCCGGGSTANFQLEKTHTFKHIVLDIEIVYPNSLTKASKPPPSKSTPPPKGALGWAAAWIIGGFKSMLSRSPIKVSWDGIIVGWAGSTPPSPLQW